MPSSVVPAAALAALLVLAGGCGSDPVTTAPAPVVPVHPNAIYLLGPEFADSVSGFEAVAALASPVGPASPDAFLRWNALTATLVAEAKTPPPLAARAFAYVSVAAHDGVIAAGSRPGPVDVDCVVGAACSGVLIELFPAFRPRIEDALGAELAGLGAPLPEAAARGLALGRLAARIAASRARGDGASVIWTGEIPVGEGKWTGTNPVLPLGGDWRTWIVTDGGEFLPPPPYAYGSVEDLADVAAVSAAVARLTPWQDAIVHRWGDRSPPSIWNEIVRAEVRARGLTALEAGHVLAYANVAMHDAFVSCWRAKYTWWTARPKHRIVNLRTAIPTPNFPSYTSGHSTISGAVAEVLADAFPDRALHFHGLAAEAAMSRLWGGIHFPQDNDRGLEAGRRIGEKVVVRMREEPFPL